MKLAEIGDWSLQYTAKQKRRRQAAAELWAFAEIKKWARLLCGSSYGEVQCKFCGKVWDLPHTNKLPLVFPAECPSCHRSGHETS